MIIIDRFQQLSSKWCLKWACSNCGYEHLDNVGFFKPNPAADKQKKCPKCNSYGKDDHLNNLKSRIEEITETKSNLDVEMERLLRQIEEIECKS